MKVLEERHGPVAKVILNWPEVMNALDMEMRLELAQLLRRLSSDEEIRAVILTGAGKAFCAGGDIRSQQGLGIPQLRKRLDAAYECINLLMRIPKPVVAAVNGPAVGAGFSLALATDIIFASDKAKFSQVFSKIGLVPDAGSIYILSRMIGLPKAKELVFTGRMIEAREALEMGLINRVVPAAELNSAVLSFAAELAHGPTAAYGLAKQLFLQAQHNDLETFLKVESYSQIIAMHTRDYKEGVSAFLEKRQPRFTGQ
ncbi:MAG: hypothetical protein C4589_01250 [Peptococcaceae bacterium]|nr:MAG: hypothetical protein C4589_01250 [Peptococcaceae bacterium]